MAMSPEYWQRARREAPIHLQIRLETRPDLRQRGRLAGGPIDRIFRDETGQLKLGQRISFFVPLDDGTDGGAHPEPMPGSGQGFCVDAAAMKAARFLEVYLAPRNDGFEVVRDQVTVLRSSTRQPVNPPDSEDYGILLPQDFWKSRRRSILARWTALGGLAMLAAFLVLTHKQARADGLPGGVAAEAGKSAPEAHRWRSDASLAGILAWQDFVNGTPQGYYLEFRFYSPSAGKALSIIPRTHTGFHQSREMDFASATDPHIPAQFIDLPVAETAALRRGMRGDIKQAWLQVAAPSGRKPALVWQMTTAWDDPPSVHFVDALGGDYLGTMQAAENNGAGWRRAAEALERVAGKQTLPTTAASNEDTREAQKRVDALLRHSFAEDLVDSGFSAPRVELAPVREKDRPLFAEIRVNVTHATGPHWFSYQVFLSPDDASRRFDSIVNPFSHASAPSAPGTTNESYSVEYKKFEPVMVVRCMDSYLDTDRSNRHTIQCWLPSGKEVVSAGAQLVQPTKSELSDGRRRVADLAMDALLSLF